MKIGLHDADAEHLKRRDKFPNYALMKLSAWHKAQGDAVEWWNAMYNDKYDVVYSSKVFSFTPVSPYLPEAKTVCGGTGYSAENCVGRYMDELPPKVDEMFPDYSIYPECDYAIGFTTRGCIRDCPWCVVPKKEGNITPYRDISELLREDTGKLVLMDNNILACGNYGLYQLGLMAILSLDTPDFELDINQGMDARLVTRYVADLLVKIRWTKYIRFACDTAAMVEPLTNAVNMLYERGVAPSRIFVYFLVNDIADAMERVRRLRELGPITLYAQAYRDFENGGQPVSKEAVEFAQRYVYPGSWRKLDWYDTLIGKKFKEGKKHEET